MKTQTVTVGNTIFGGDFIPVISGPCSVENREQILLAAECVLEAGAQLLRGGAFKPRTRPESFQGLGLAGVDLLCEARQSTGLPIVTELMDVRLLDEFLRREVDLIQVGSRNMQNFDLLKELGNIQTPILLKRGLAATLDEWLAAADYIATGGNQNIILCERGIRSFESSYRNTLDISAVPALKMRTPFPVIVDPSHAAGKVALIPALAKAAIAAGADGLIIEMHPNPEASWSDAEQALSVQELRHLMGELQKIALAVGRQLKPI
jgi:3-deoxy-7-phosphoheptulonate synthase